MKTLQIHLTNRWRPLIDLAVLSLALWLAYMLRFDWALPDRDAKHMVLVWPYTVFVEYLMLWLFGVPRFVWKYVSLKEMRSIFAALAVSFMLLSLVRFLIPFLHNSVPITTFFSIPYGVIILNFGIAFLGIVGVRVSSRLQNEQLESDRHRGAGREQVATILIGAGQAGVLTAQEIQRRPDLGMRIVGYLDDDKAKQGQRVAGHPVLGGTADIERICARKDVKKVLITIASASGADIRRIVKLCKNADVAASIVPGMHELVSGKANLSRIREVAIEDLLRRAPVQLEVDKIAAIIRNKNVVVSGAGGSIGSELCRQICEFEPARLILLERAENNLFSIHKELIETYPSLNFVPCLLDIGMRGQVDEMFARYKPDLVFHAAAHKHVPMLEWNPGEGIKNNIFGTRNLADVAHAHKVNAFVMVSTDKAVNPSSVMGTTKRVAEMYIQALSQHSQTHFITVRFGNVLGSVGSVVPIFKQQIARGGPITITHPDMQRYFMTIPEASQLVLQAGTMGTGGEIYVLDMGEPVKIVDLARDLISLSGLTPELDIQIKFTGVRPGEKLFEELRIDGEVVDKTKHEKILVMKFKPGNGERLEREIEALEPLINNNNVDQIKRALQGIVPEYTSPEAPAAKAPAESQSVPSTAT